MEHPLLALARAYDRAVPSEGHTLRDEVESWLETEPAEAVVAYAAHFSVLTQTCQLGRHGIWEEPQTDALYGLLASSLWHAQFLEDSYPVSPEEDGERPRTRYWVHQNKNQEAQSGYDFGIVTHFGENNVKITLFQAKRPKDEAAWKKISLGHVIRKNTGQTPPDDTLAKKQQEAIADIKQWIEDGAKGDEIPSFLTIVATVRNCARMRSDTARVLCSIPPIRTFRVTFSWRPRCADGSILTRRRCLVAGAIMSNG